MEQDIEMKESESVRLLREEYVRTLTAIDEASLLKDASGIARSFRLINKFRSQFSPEEISYLVDTYLRHFYPCNWISSGPNLSTEFNVPTKITPHVRENCEFLLYNSLLVITVSIDRQEYQNTLGLIKHVLSFLSSLDYNFTINYLRAKVYYFYALVSEKLGQLGNIVDELQQLHKQAAVNLDENSQVVLINCILRYYIACDNYEAAANFITKTKFNSNINVYEEARHLYYNGRLDAVQLRYSDAYANLVSALRKAPENCGESFKVIVKD